MLEGTAPQGINSSMAEVFPWKFKNSFFITYHPKALASLFLSGLNLTIPLLDHNPKQPHCCKFQLSQGRDLCELLYKELEVQQDTIVRKRGEEVLFHAQGD